MSRGPRRLDRALRDGGFDADPEIKSLIATAASITRAFPTVSPPNSGRTVFAAAAESRRRRSSLRIAVPVAGMALVVAVVAGAYTATPEQPLFEIRQVLSSIGLVDNEDETAQQLYERALDEVGIAEAAARAGQNGTALRGARITIVLVDRARQLLGSGTNEVLREKIGALELRAFAVIATVLPDAAVPGIAPDAERDRGAGRDDDSGSGDEREQGKGGGDRDRKGDEDDPENDKNPPKPDDPTATPTPTATPIESDGEEDNGRGNEGENGNGSGGPGDGDQSDGSSAVEDDSGSDPAASSDTGEQPDPRGGRPTPQETTSD